MGGPKALDHAESILVLGRVDKVWVVYVVSAGGSPPLDRHASPDDIGILSTSASKFGDTGKQAISVARLLLRPSHPSYYPQILVFIDHRSVDLEGCSKFAVPTPGTPPHRDPSTPRPGLRDG